MSVNKLEQFVPHLAYDLHIISYSDKSYYSIKQKLKAYTNLISIKFKENK